MTEYDYSPDAYERYQAKMAGVGSWVSEQRFQAPKYSNPFLPTAAANMQATVPLQTPVARSPERSRPEPRRSKTLPAGGNASASGSGQSSRTYAYAQHSTSPERSSRTRDPKRAGTLPLAVTTHVRHASVSSPVQQSAVQRTSPAIYAPPASGYKTRQVEYRYEPGKPIVLPPPRPGERYVIIPPKGGRVDVVQDSRDPSRSSSRSSGKTSSPTKKTNDALLKRLFTNITPTIEWNGQRSGKRSTSR